MDPLRGFTPAFGLQRPSRPQGEAAEVAEGPQERFEATAVRPGRAAEEFEEEFELIHPATALEFRRPLEEILGRLPYALLRGIAQQGYVLHVVDSEGHHPLTLDVEVGDFDLEEELVREQPIRLADLAAERGADSQWLPRVLELNPDLDPEAPVPAGQPLYVPACGWWQGRCISTAAHELVTRPLRTTVAGMVYNGVVAGLQGEGLRLVLWDKVFRRGDGLTDWYVLHELGHCTDFTYAFRWPDRWRDWTARVLASFAQRSTFLTRYSSESPTEYFAEGFAAWATPPGHQRDGTAVEELERERTGLDRDALRARDARLYDLIEEAVTAASS